MHACTHRLDECCGCGEDGHHTDDEVEVFAEAVGYEVEGREDLRSADDDEGGGGDEVGDDLAVGDVEEANEETGEDEDKDERAVLFKEEASDDCEEVPPMKKMAPRVLKMPLWTLIHSIAECSWSEIDLIMRPLSPGI